MTSDNLPVIRRVPMARGDLVGMKAEHGAAIELGRFRAVVVYQPDLQVFTCPVGMWPAVARQLTARNVVVLDLEATPTDDRPQWMREWPWCGACSDPVGRWVKGTEDRPIRCQCHPRHHAPLSADPQLGNPEGHRPLPVEPPPARPEPGRTQVEINRDGVAKCRAALAAVTKPGPLADDLDAFVTRAEPDDPWAWQP